VGSEAIFIQLNFLFEKTGEQRRMERRAESVSDMSPFGKLEEGSDGWLRSLQKPEKTQGFIENHPLRSSTINIVSIPPFSRSSINFLEHNRTAGDQLSHNSLSQRQELSKIPAGLAVRIAPDNQLSHFTG